MAKIKLAGATLSSTEQRLVQVASDMLETIGTTEQDRAALLEQYRSDESTDYDAFKQALDEAYRAMQGVVDAGGQWAARLSASAAEMPAAAASAWRGA
jgi:hypothetical protein